jgi:hypothetical protein
MPTKTMLVWDALTPVKTQAQCQGSADAKFRPGQLSGFHVHRYIDKPVEMSAAGLPPFGSNATGVCWPNYDFDGADELSWPHRVAPSVDANMGQLER